MAIKEEESFTIMWRIRNFSMCPETLGRLIESPIIRVRKFGNSEWVIQLNPKGKIAGFISCFLNCNSSGTYENLKIELTLTVIPELSEENRTTMKIFNRSSTTWGYNYFISKKLLLKEKDKYLPKDTLTIKCSMKCKNLCDSKNTEEEILEGLLRKCTLFGKNSLNIDECCIETVIPFQTKSLLWPIGRFLSISENKRITLPVFSAMKDAPSFYVTVIKKDGSPLRIEIENKGNSSKILIVKCTVSAVNSPKGVSYCSEDQFLYKSANDLWIFPPFLELSKLEKDGYFKLNEETLYLQFDFIFSIDGQMHHTEKKNWDHIVLPPFKSQSPMGVLTLSLTDNDQTVVTLRSEGRTFTVHMALLKAMSEVFHAMFENDMKEKETGVVDITDVEPETLGRMLSFFYCGAVGDLSTTDVISLYAAAHKYQVVSLMDYCSSVLMSSLTVSNVCDILKFADLYRDDRLLKNAENVIIANSNCILMLQDWKNLMENHPSLAANVMYKMLI